MTVAGADGALLTIMDANYALLKRGNDLLRVVWDEPMDEATVITQLEAYLAAIP